MEFTNLVEIGPMKFVLLILISIAYSSKTNANDDENKYSTYSIGQVKYLNVPLTKPLYSIPWIRKGNAKYFEEKVIILYQILVLT